MKKEISVKTHDRCEMLDITAMVKKFAAESGIADGIVLVYVPHTTAGVTINENADPSVVDDILMELDKIVPHDDNYRHLEGNSAAHLKTTMTGSSVSIIVDKGKLLLGTWQGIYFCEYDGPRNRKCILKALPDGGG